MSPDQTPAKSDPIMCYQDFLVMQDPELAKQTLSEPIIVLSVNVTEVSFQSAMIDGTNIQKVIKIKATIVYKFKANNSRMVCKLNEVRNEIRDVKRNVQQTEIERSDTMEALACLAVGGVPDMPPHLIARFMSANAGSIDKTVHHYVLQQVFIPGRFLESLVKIKESVDPSKTQEKGGFMANNFQRSEVAHPPNAFSFYFMKNKLQMFFNTNEKEWVADKKNRYYEANFDSDISACGISSNLNCDQPLDFYLTAMSVENICYWEKITKVTNYRRTAGNSFQITSTDPAKHLLINFLPSISTIFRLGFSCLSSESIVDLHLELIPIDTEDQDALQLDARSSVIELGVLSEKPDLQIKFDESYFHSQFKIFYFLNSEFKKKVHKLQAPPQNASKKAGLSVFVMRKTPLHDKPAEGNKPVSRFGWYLHFKLGLDESGKPIVESYTKTEIILPHACRVPWNQTPVPALEDIASQEQSIQYLSCFLGSSPNIKQANKRVVIIPYFMPQTQPRTDHFIKFLCLTNVEICIAPD